MTNVRRRIGHSNLSSTKQTRLFYHSCPQSCQSVWEQKCTTSIIINSTVINSTSSINNDIPWGSKRLDTNIADKNDKTNGFTQSFRVHPNNAIQIDQYYILKRVKYK